MAYQMSASSDILAILSTKGKTDLDTRYRRPFSSLDVEKNLCRINGISSNHLFIPNLCPCDLDPGVYHCYSPKPCSRANMWQQPCGLLVKHSTLACLHVSAIITV